MVVVEAIVIKRCAFKERQMEFHPNLVEIGKEIVAKCKQVPLAVINLGTQMYGKTDEKEWGSVRDSEKWEEEGRWEPKFLDLLLVQSRMAHGLIQSSNPNDDLEHVGLCHVRELISNGTLSALPGQKNKTEVSADGYSGTSICSMLLLS
ncbi:PREDICTED: uncharacterized protein LOC105135313 [Populus euphratica]|uniref:Uncharacterized protein LOC105135313 n=1 Tax=Populus euphratica TaxID=75702 RepID=A0AAJ6UYE4_POPEU|nr:PREDICTED: uncharacterized protein LOC105135313 [Populus euphratica]